MFTHFLNIDLRRTRIMNEHLQIFVILILGERELETNKYSFS